MAKFFERLRQLRTARNLSQMELAKSIGISKSSINMYERGEREPGLETLEHFADFFNVDMDYLLGKSDTVNKAYKENLPMFNSVQLVRDLCREQSISIAKLEKDCGFSNGYLNPKKMSKLPYDRAVIIAEYLGVSSHYILTGMTENPYIENSVDRVIAICKERKIPLSRLEKDLGYGNGYIGQLRKGVFPSDRLMEIAEYLGISTNYILTGTEKSTPTIAGKRASDDIQLSAAEQNLIRKFRRLDDRGRSAVLNVLEHEYTALPGNAPASRRQA